METQEAEDLIRLQIALDGFAPWKGWVITWQEEHGHPPSGDFVWYGKWLAKPRNTTYHQGWYVDCVCYFDEDKRHYKTAGLQRLLRTIDDNERRRPATYP